MSRYLRSPVAEGQLPVRSRAHHPEDRRSVEVGEERHWRLRRQLRDGAQEHHNEGCQFHGAPSIEFTAAAPR